MNIINFIKFKLDRRYLLKHKNGHPVVKAKHLKNKLYFIATFNKKIIQIFDMTYLYTLNIDEFYNNFLVVRR